MLFYLNAPKSFDTRMHLDISESIFKHGMILGTTELYILILV